MYSEADFLSRPAFTDPEILRTNLASVILQMTALGLGDIAAFPFVEAPDKRHIQDGVRLLEELGALTLSEEGHYKLTGSGRQLAQLPVDPRLARMVLAARQYGCVREVMIIAAGLSIQDPRERPAERSRPPMKNTGVLLTKSLILWPLLTCGTTWASSKSAVRQCLPSPV